MGARDDLLQLLAEIKGLDSLAPEDVGLIVGMTKNVVRFRARGESPPRFGLDRDMQEPDAPLRTITCGRCNRTSYSQADVKAGYCGWCHAFTQGTVKDVE